MSPTRDRKLTLAEALRDWAENTGDLPEHLHLSCPRCGVISCLHDGGTAYGDYFRDPECPFRERGEQQLGESIIFALVRAGFEPKLVNGRVAVPDAKQLPLRLRGRLRLYAPMVAKALAAPANDVFRLGLVRLVFGATLHDEQPSEIKPEMEQLLLTWEDQ